MSKIAIVTGAGSGVGRATSLALIKEGYKVLLVGRRKQKLLETKSNAIQNNYTGEGIIHSLDVTNEKLVKSFFTKVAKEFGRLDVLFNNAGKSTSPQTIDQLSYSEWKSVVDVNLNGMFLCAKYAFKIMRNQKPIGGRIINNGSISASTPRPGSIAYTATKHAVTGLTKTISLDGRKLNIVCSQIDIGNAETPMTQIMKKGVMQSNGYIEREPVMKASDVAEAIVYIARLPLSANVLNMTIMANQMPFIGRG